MRNKLLILGSMDEFVELVKKARARGIVTVVCDGYADGPAKAFADTSYTIDIHDTSAIVEMCRKEGIASIVTAYSDVLAECAATIAQAAGISFYASPESLSYVRDKVLMKKMFDELRIPYPKTISLRRETPVSVLESLHFPVVTKPINAWGSHGVYLLDAPNQVFERFEDVACHSQDGTILIEEYNDGFEFNMMTWVVEGVPVVLEIADREKSHEIPFGTPHVSRIVYPSVLTDCVLADAREIVSRVARYIGMQYGPLCMQFFWKPNMGIQVCECAGRVFGYEHELLELATGGALTIEDLLLDTALCPDNLSVRLANHDPHLSRIAAGLYFHGYECKIGRIDGIPELGMKCGAEIAHVLNYYAPGDTISHGIGAKPYVVRAYLVGDERAEVDALTDELFHTVRVEDSQGKSILYHNERPSYK